MRLSNTQKQALVYATQWFDWEVFLFGSRVDADKRWWDVDVLLMPYSNEQNLRAEIDIASKYRYIVDEKIDIVSIPYNIDHRTRGQQIFLDAIHTLPIWV